MERLRIGISLLLIRKAQHPKLKSWLRITFKSWQCESLQFRMLVALVLLQLALGLHVRNVLIDAVGEGAWRAALVGGTTAEAEARVRALAGAALSGDCVQAV